MAAALWRRQTFSIATDGLELVTGDQLTTIMGGLIMELVSAPIQPGIYTIRLTALMGDIRIFLPAYAKAELQGASFWGGKRIYRNNEFWYQMRAAFAGSDVQVPATPPPWAHASYTEYPVTLRFIINTIMGRASVYQLESNTVANTHGNL
jgi:hypothetical protein